MKYIKRFNESIDEQCEVYISELADLEISVAITVFDTLIVLYISGDGELFSWEYVKETMIPFLEFLNNKYTIHNIVIEDEYEDEDPIDEYDEYHDEREVTFDNIISDDFNSSEISWLQIKLK